MFAEPTASPVTTPVAETDAIVGLSDVHETCRPVKTLPAASLGTAVACVVWPVVTLVARSVTVTVATGTGGAVVTFSVATPTLVSTVAWMLADPAATAVTTPNEETVATPGLSDDQVTGRPVNTAPTASFATAVAWVVWPGVRLELPRTTDTVATGGGGGGGADTVRAASPVFDSLV